MSEKVEPLTTEEWAEFLKAQADRTREYRYTVYEKVDIRNKRKALDVGCGTGAVTSDIAFLTPGHLTGVDIDDRKLEYARGLCDHVTFVQADALYLPFKDNTFDLVVFSVLLMHVHNKQKAVHEMARVTQPGGVVLATMEPDHAGALCYPENVTHGLFVKHLQEVGADICSGRKLRSLFTAAGLTAEIGINTYNLDMMNKGCEEQVENFLAYFSVRTKVMRKNGWTEQHIENHKKEQIELIEKGQYFFFLPVFYAIGRKI